MIIQHNIMALNAHRQLTGNTSQVGKNIEKLSSGFKINRAGDDASGLAISEKMRAQIKGLEVAQKNAQDGISLIQTAEGALTEVHSMLNRMVELAEKSANGTIQNDVDRDAIQKEANDLLSEIDRISKATNFNGINLLDGSLTASSGIKGVTSTLTAATGTSWTVTADEAANGTATFTYTDANGVNQDVTAALLTADSNIQSGTKIAAALTGDTGFSELFDVTDNLDGTVTITDKTVGLNTGAKHSFATASAATMFTVGAPVAATNSSISLDFTDATFKAGTSISVEGKNFYIYDSSLTEDEDVAKGLNANKDGYIGIDASGLNQAALADAVGAAVVGGVGATQAAYVGGTDVLTIKSLSNNADPDVQIDGVAITSTTDGSGNTIGGLTLQIGDTNESHQKVTVSVDDLSATGLGIKGLNVSNQEAAGKAIADIKAAINKVSTNRANLGGLQNRLDHTINNLSVTEENMTAAESRIRDVDMAKEMMSFTKNNVLTQAAQAMLAQANTQPQSVLQLLQ